MRTWMKMSETAVKDIRIESYRSEERGKCHADV